MLRLFLRHRTLLAVLVISTLVAGACTKYNTRGNLLVGAAAADVMIDDPDASIAYRPALTQDVTSLQKRAELYGRMMVTEPVLADIAHRAKVPADQLSGIARTTADVPIPLLEPGSEERASQIRDSRKPYRIEMQSYPGEPILGIYAEAPSVDEAQRLADSAVLGLHDYLDRLAAKQGADTRRMPQIRRLGEARASLTNGKARYVIGLLTFVTAFALCFVVLYAAARRLRRRGDDDGEPEPQPVSRLTGRAAEDWPRTSRLLPWSIAAFIAMIWLTPFDKIQLSMSTPIDITLDRIVLPLVAAIWLIALTAGPGAAPRVRLTRVHLALGAFLACAFLSVVLDARYLNQTGELMLAFKKLPLLVSYMSIFVIVASSVRRSEVPAMLTYTLVLAVICGIGVIIEHKFKTNLFTTWSQKLAVGPFEYVADGNGSGLDALGRRWIAGPTAYGLEVVTMMTIALPIAVNGVLKSEELKRKALFGFAIAVLFAAMFATERKSALIAPVAAVLTLAYFRRRELLSLAPFGMVIAVMVTAISPGAIRGIVSQFTRSDASHVATVSDRTADYDAVRPDLWTHLLFGRGHGTYAHDSYRILDSEILSRLVETGVLGLATFVLICVSVVLVARKTVAARDPRWAPAALCGVAAAVSFIVVGTLFDVMAVPHGTDTFLYIAGLVVAVVGPGTEGAAPEPARRRTAVLPAPRVARPAPRTREPAGVR